MMAHVTRRHKESNQVIIKIKRRIFCETENNGRFSPVVFKLASEHNIDLTQVQGTGFEGRVTKKIFNMPLNILKQLAAQTKLKLTTKRKIAVLNFQMKQRINHKVKTIKAQHIIKVVQFQLKAYVKLSLKIW